MDAYGFGLASVLILDDDMIVQEEPKQTKWGPGIEEGTLDGGDEVQQGKVEGENGSILWGMIKQV